MTASVARFIESFIPENYNLFLDINRSEKTFTGNVAITGEAIDNHISLHQKDLTINSVLLDNESLNFQMDDANEAFHIELPETGVLTIFIEFSGRITDNMTDLLDLIIHILAGYIHIIQFRKSLRKILHSHPFPAFPARKLCKCVIHDRGSIYYRRHANGDHRYTKTFPGDHISVVSHS